MRTHVLHFLQHSGTATSRHSRPGHCGPFVYPGKRRPVGEAPGAGPRFALPPAALQGAKPPAHPDTRSAWQTVRRTALSMSPSRVLCLWAFCSPGFPGVSSAGPPWATSAQARTSRRWVSAVPRAQDFSWVLLLARRHQGCPRSAPRVGLSVQRQERAGPAHRDRGREGRGITVAGPTHLLAWRPWAPGLQLGAPERVSAARDCLTLASLSPSGVAFWLDLAGETKS